MRRALPFELVDDLSFNPPFLLALFLPLMFIYTWLYSFYHKDHKNQPPSPPKLPILGNLHQLGTFPHRSLRSLSQQYGELSLLHLGSKPALIVSSANAAKEVLKNHDLEFSDRPKFKFTQRLLYVKDLAFSQYGEYWKQMRGVCVKHLLSNTMIRSFRTIREEETALMAQKIRNSVPTAVNLSDIIFTVVNDILSRVVFGRKFCGEEETKFKELIKRLLKLLGAFSVADFIPWLGLIDKLNGLDRSMDEVWKEFDMLIEQIIEEHLDGVNNTPQDNEVMDFVDVLFGLQMDATSNLSLDRESMKALIMDMLAGGSFTTYTAIEWTMSELLKHPEALKKLQEEIRGISKGKGGLHEEDMNQMKYLKAVIKETYRLHPPVPLLTFRESTKDTQISGYDIAARTPVMINAWAIHRDPANWEEPDEFCPERFLNSSVGFMGQHFELIPFGSGRRSCPGIGFSVANTELVLANIVHSFNWSLPDGVKCETLDMSECPGLSVHKRDPLLALATPYSYK